MKSYMTTTKDVVLYDEESESLSQFTILLFVPVSFTILRWFPRPSNLKIRPVQKIFRKNNLRIQSY